MFVLSTFYSYAIKLLECFEKKGTDTHIDPSNLKFALVKQYTYADLYSKSFIGIGGEERKNIIFSSNHRSGPIALILDLCADVFIVDTFDESICQVFREKGENTNWTSLAELQRSQIVDAQNVDWGQYDIVICMENALPSSLTFQYPNVVWATMLEFHRMKSYRDYLKKPPKGYNVFFNQRFGPTPFNVFKRNHVIDWPYALNTPLDIELFGVYNKNESAVVDCHSKDNNVPSILKMLGYGVEMTNSGRRISDHLRLLARTKLLILPIQSSERMLWGNITLEASALSCLIIGNRRFLWNPHIIARECDVKSMSQLKDLLEALKDESFYQELLGKQQKNLIHYGFNRPLKQLSKWMTER